MTFDRDWILLAMASVYLGLWASRVRMGVLTAREHVGFGMGVVIAAGTIAVCVWDVATGMGGGR
jgi:hypothetical protein